MSRFPLVPRGSKCSNLGLSPECAGEWGWAKNTEFCTGMGRAEGERTLLFPVLSDPTPHFNSLPVISTVAIAWFGEGSQSLLAVNPH
jgi:hypothetical protein